MKRFGNPFRILRRPTDLLEATKFPRLAPIISHDALDADVRVDALIVARGQIYQTSRPTGVRQMVSACRLPCEIREINSAIASALYLARADIRGHLSVRFPAPIAGILDLFIAGCRLRIQIPL